MAKLSTLFERRVVTRPYPTMAAELDAVRDGRKAIAMEVWPAGELDADHARFVRLAHARGLQTLEQPDTSRAGVPIVAVYALYAEQAWRVPALHALWRVSAPWTESAEALEGHLLGYTATQIDTWLAERRQERCGWTGTTIYLLVSTARRRILERTGLRYVHPDALAGGVTAAWCPPTQRPRRRLPAWVDQLARLAIADDAAAALFAGRASVTLAPAHADLVNAALHSRIELHGPRGWSSRVAMRTARHARRRPRGA